MIKTDDPWFRPVDIKTGPDGDIYFADMYEQHIDHSSHYAGRVDKKTGRIYKLTNKGERPGVSPEYFSIRLLKALHCGTDPIA